VYTIVPDTNVLVSGSTVPHGNPAFILDSWRSEKVQIVTSLEILDEFQRVMLEKFNAPKTKLKFLMHFSYGRVKLLSQNRNSMLSKKILRTINFLK